MRRLIAGWGLATLALAALPAAAASRVVVVATTTSVQDSGLLDVLVPMFERRTALAVKPIPVGTGQALALAARGEADVVLAHAPALERQYVAQGALRNRRPVMANDFVVVGPPGDPARVQGAGTAVEALRRIAATGARFISRGDRSGTHAVEVALWRTAGLEPRAPWYLESGQGMGATLAIASDRRAYSLTDRATLLALGRRLDLAIVLAGGPDLRNVYAVLEVNPANGPRVNAAGGRAFADFLVSPDAQEVIRTFGVDRYGRALFVPLAGRAEAED